MSDENQQQELSESQLADMAAQLDAGGEVSLPEAAQSPEATPAPDAANIEKKDGEEPPKETEPSAQDKGPGTEAAKQPDKKTDNPPDKPESEYLKAKKEQERRDRSWQKLEEEKAQLRKEREELEAARQKTDKAAQPRDDTGYSADDYDGAAKQFDAAGETEMAAKARAKAQELRQSAQTRQSEAQVNDFRQKWTETVNKVLDEKPELKDMNTPLAKKVQEALKANPHFSATPDGFRRLVEHVELQDKAASVPGLQAEVEKLTKEIDRLNKALSVGGSGPAQRPGVKSFDDMTAVEREAELTRMAEEADRQAA